MDKVIEAAKELRKAIDNTEIAKEYHQLKALFENDTSLKQMREDIARLASEGKKEERDNLLEVYNRHPLVVNYRCVEEEMKYLLKEIQSSLE